MSKLTVIAGDFPAGAGRFTIRNFTLPGDANHYLCETVAASQIAFLNNATNEFLQLLETDDETKKFINSAGHDQIFFLAKLNDNRRFIAATDHKTFHKIIKALERETDVSLEVTPSAA